MALIPTEVKQALTYLRSIDVSLGRIANALEQKKSNEGDKNDSKGNRVDNIQDKSGS